MNHECHYHNIPHRRSYAHESQQWQYRMGESIASIRRLSDENILTLPGQSEEEDINSSNGARIISGDFGSYDRGMEIQLHRTGVEQGGSDMWSDAE
uniref:Helicase C-terminal domain-containing protein n=1 Tax=Parascaris univalens TaxID=6257 RepID=A0A915AUD3_PARUN